MTTSRKSSSKSATDRNFFQLCFPCFGRSSIDCDEIMFKSFGREFTEYEYVIENLAIRRAPKVLLDSYQPPPKIKSRYGQTKKPKTRDFGGSVTKKIPEVTAGPIVREAEEEDQPRPANQKGSLTASQGIAGVSPCYMPSLPKRAPQLSRSPCRTRELGDDSNKGASVLHEDVMKKALIPPNAVYRVDVPQKMKVSADIHKDNGDAKMDNDNLNKRKGIPTEIQETINALKVARPVPLTSFPRKNHRNLMRSVSDTSCDKETFCNFLGLEYFKEETTEETRSSNLDYRYMDNKRKPFSQFRKRASSAKRPGSLLGMFTEDMFSHVVANFDGVISGSGEHEDAIVHDDTTEIKKDKSILKSQSLKWKIIINKHKDKKNASKEKKLSK